MISITETYLQTMLLLLLLLEWPCMISITETRCKIAQWLDCLCWNGHVWFRSLKHDLPANASKRESLEWPCMISITETASVNDTTLHSKLEWPCMISITETIIPTWFGLGHFVGMAMYDFDHWNLITIVLPSRAVVGMAMYDFDHWNKFSIWLFGLANVGMAMYDFDHWNLNNNLWSYWIRVGMAMYDFDHWNIFGCATVL